MDRLECNMDMESRKQEYYRARGADGKIVVEEDQLMDVWRAHYDKISNFFSFI